MLRRALPARSLTAATPRVAATAAAPVVPSLRFASSAAPPPFWGDTVRGVRSCKASVCRLSDVVGVSGSGGSGTCVSSRLAAGELLSLVDICAARAASKHVFGKFTMGFGEGGSGTPKNEASVATVAMDQMVFSKPIMAGDLIDLKGTVVDVGASSIAVNVDVRRVQFGTKERSLVASALVFMVAVDSTLKAAKIVPALELDPDNLPWLMEKHAKVQEAKANVKRFKAFEKTLTAPDATTATLLAAQPDLFTRDPTKNYSVPIASTEHIVNRLFFPSHLNLNNTVFGGELLRWMEAHAVHCGRSFARNRNGVFTIGMHAIEFNRPVYKSDWMRLEAHVVCAKRTTMEVDVQVFAETDGKTTTTNRANFVLASLDEAGQKLALPAGLHVTEQDDFKWQKRHVLATKRYDTLREVRLQQRRADLEDLSASDGARP